LNVTLDGQITDRFSRAIDHLGDKRIAARLGGIYELNRIASDSEKDRVAIIDTLSGFIREKAPAPKLMVHRKSPMILPTVRSDIQAALTVLLRHNATSPGYIDLSRTDLAKADLAGACLKGAILEEAWLEGANLNQSILDGADLRLAHLETAQLEGASCAATDFAGAYLELANFSGADLSDIHGIDAHILSHAVTNAATILPAYISDEDLAAAKGNAGGNIP